MMHPGSWFRPLPLLLGTFLLACGGGGGGPTGPVTGSLAVAVSGLPGGASAAVAVTGPGAFSRSVTGTETLSNLTPGSYTLSASIVTFGGSAYAPTPTAQAVTVNEGDTPAAAAVAYATVVSGLTVTVDGLPSGASADITVTGPGGFSQTITATRTFNDLPAGSYSITANSVSSGGSDYSPNPPSQTVAVTSGSVASAGVSYSVVIPGALNLKIDGMYLTQSVQTYAGAVPLVQGRDGYLRVFVTANQSNVATPSVRVRFYNNGLLTQTMTITAPGLTTPLSSDESSLTKSWNVAVPKALIQPNLSILADVDPTNVVAEANEGDNHFPLSATPLAMDVRTASSFSVRFVPVLQSVNGRLGDVTSGNKDQFLTEAMKMHPLSAYDADLHTQFTTGQPAVDANNTNGAWGAILSELTTLRNADGSSRYYYGVINPTYSSGVAGIGWVGGQVAVGWDKLPSGAAVAAHEWGHNWGRQHAPCGGAANPDANFPQTDGAIGAYGLDVATATLKPPTYKDLMGYCNPEWISDYTYTAVLNYRTANPDVSSALSQAMQSCLLVWGRIENGRLVLEPAFEVVTRPHLPAKGGEYVVEGRAADGSRIFSLPFTPADVADDPRQGQLFSFAIPLSGERTSRLSTIRVAGRGREAITYRTGGLPQAGDRVPLSVTRTGGGRVALQWDAARHPMLLVRDGGTGQIISFARGGRIELPATYHELSVGFSNGVRSSELRVPVPSR